MTLPTSSSSSPSPVSSPELARFAEALAGQYEIVREVGRGGMGVVYLARDLKLDRPVAIKTLPSHLAADATLRDRFLREARTAASLNHPNIVPIHRADELGDFVFFVMGYVDGESLAQRVRSRGPLTPSALVPILLDVALALGYAHSRGVVHRDVKEENILLDGASRAMVTDFGIARLAQSAPMTLTGTVLGTVFYMSPEQVSGDPVDGRSDLYSFGVLAFHALSGKFPFDSDTPSAVLVAHVTKSPPPLRSVAPAVPHSLAAIVDRLLRKDRNDRFVDANELADALQDVERTLPPDVEVREGVLSSTEAHAVWERAALLQEMTGQMVPPPSLPRRENADRSPSLTSGYRVDDVREAAAEVGIASRYVDRALAERAGAGEVASTVQEGPLMTKKANPFVGARTKLEYEAVVDGELIDTDFEDVADVIRRSIGDLGNVNTIGKSVTWTSWGAMNPASQRKLQISVSSRNGRTVIRGFEDLTQISGGILGGITGGVGGGVGGASFGITLALTKTALIAAPVFGGIVLGAYTLARTIFTYISGKRERELRGTIESVAERVRECVAARRLPRAAENRRLGR
jgi:eukaryotic-like serine/threonine-protein kinase